MIIDDDEHAARALWRYLSQHEGIVETDGRRALARFLADRFDAVFCEIRMPDFGGLEFYEAVAARQPELLRRVVLVCSGPLEQSVEERVVSQGIASTTKPYDADEVRRLVDERLPQ